MLADAKEPLYIVDGVERVCVKQIPPVDSIASVSTIDSAEAVNIYGERASGGVVVVHTKAYKKHLSDTKSRMKFSNTFYFLEFVIFLLLIIIGTNKPLVERICCRLKGEKSRIIEQQISDEKYRQLSKESRSIIPETLLSRGIDPLFAEAAMYIVGTGRANSAALQKYFDINKERADKLIKQLKAERIISDAGEDGNYELLYVDIAELMPLFDKLGIEWE